MQVWPAGESTILGRLPDEHRRLLLTYELELESGEVLFKEGRSGEVAYFLREGAVEVRNGAHRHLFNAGAAVGEIDLLLANGTDISAHVLESARVAVLSRSSLEDAMKTIPAEIKAQLEQEAFVMSCAEEVSRLLREHFPILKEDDALFQTLRGAAETIQLRGGDFLCRAGEEADAMYLVVRGRLRVVNDDGDVLATLGPGDVVGERALLLDERRNRSVQVARTATVAKIHRGAFDHLVATNAAFVKQLATSVITHARSARVAERDQQIVALVRISQSPSVDKVAAHLSEALTQFTMGMVTAAQVAAELGVGTTAITEYETVLIESWLESQAHERESQWIDAGSVDNAWSRLVCGRADRLVLIADADASPVLTRLELEKGQLMASSSTSLILVHPEGTRLPVGTSAWLEPRDLVSHHHVELGNAGDICRAARLISGCGVGVVLAGGGALGAAHVGALAALIEAGVPIDYLGGTSAGGGVAASFAMHRDFGMAHSDLVANFVENNIWRHKTLPYLSVVQMAGVDGAARDMYGDVQIEDLWIPWFGISASLRTGQQVVHQRGPLWQAVRATSSVPGLIAPMIVDGEELVDGGIINNFPARVMKSLCRGPVIGLDIIGSGSGTTGSLSYDELPTGRDVFKSLLSRKRLPKKLPTIRRVMMQLMVLGNKREIAAQREACTWYFKPDLRHFTMADFGRFGDIARVGYSNARRQIAASEIADIIPNWPETLPPSHTAPRRFAPESFGRGHSSCAAPGKLRTPPRLTRYGDLSLGPLKSLRSVLNGLTPTLRAAQAEAWAPVFDIHIGQPMVVVTEARAADFLFRAQTSVVDRGEPRTFGPIGVRPELVPFEPLLTANSATHGPLAAFVDHWLERRRAEFRPSLEVVMDQVMAEWVESTRVPLLAGLRDLVARACVHWLLGVTLRKNDVNAFLEHVFEPLPTGKLAATVARGASRCPRSALTLKGDLQAMARDSPFRDELDTLGRRFGVQDPLGHMVFIALFNAAGGASGVIMPGLLEVMRAPRLQRLVEGDAPLDDLVLECHRLYGRPVLFSRVAKQDFALPTTVGDFQILAGTSLTIATRMCQTDPDVFHNPQRFDPERYLRAPQERDFVFGSGAPPDAPSGYRCRAADSGIQRDLVGLVIRRLVRAMTWQTSTDPVFDERYDLYVGPKDLELTGLAWRRCHHEP